MTDTPGPTAAEPPVRVLLADDQEIVRAGLRLILESRPGVSVVAECGDGAAAVEAARRLRPDVVLCDIEMPKLDGTEVTRVLAAEGLRVVVLTAFDHDEYVHAALRNGACGYVLKHSGPALLLEAVRAAVAGDALVSPSITVKLLKRVVGKPSARDVPLTEREEDVLRLLARGHANGEIAQELFIAPSTVKTHVQSLQRKLGARNRVEMAAWAWRTGLVE
ncbi:response regulator transcription factor [Nonomuraea sp. NPDC000554]|uniref:response regulator transcription factor n=1 Tax=Nonomuraea sp. NPDC000554 TaxID=3154259 RepID=UPI003328564A